MNKEIWKDIKDYEGLYQISNLGNVRSLDRVVERHGLTNLPGRMMKTVIHSNGYVVISLSKNGKRISYFVHRLVAEAFIPNPNNYPLLNHKNEIKNDNRVENIEWCDYKYNVNYGTSIARRTEKFKKKICQYSLDDTFIRVWDSMKEAA